MDGAVVLNPGCALESWECRNLGKVLIPGPPFKDSGFIRHQLLILCSPGILGDTKE